MTNSTTQTTAADVLGRLRQLIREHYVIGERAPAIADALDGRELDLDGKSPAAAAELLTARLRAVSPDRHLRVAHTPDIPPQADPERWSQRMAREASENAGGIRQVRRLDAETGLLQIAPYTSPVHLAERYVTAAFTLLADVRRLVIDVRDGRGGTPETIALICGYLLGDDPVHLQDIVSRDGSRRQFWTAPAAGRLGADVQVSVLTSGRTFSGCEELAYNLQALGRATVVGETTGGGAHPVEVFGLADGLDARIPVAASVNATTGSNWEQVGVVPDIRCPAADALRVALRGRHR